MTLNVYPHLLKHFNSRRTGRDIKPIHSQLYGLVCNEPGSLDLVSRRFNYSGSVKIHAEDACRRGPILRIYEDGRCEFLKTIHPRSISDSNAIFKTLNKGLLTRHYIQAASTLVGGPSRGVRLVVYGEGVSYPVRKGSVYDTVNRVMLTGERDTVQRTDRKLARPAYEQADRVLKIATSLFMLGAAADAPSIGRRLTSETGIPQYWAPDEEKVFDGLDSVELVDENLPTFAMALLATRMNLLARSYKNSVVLLDDDERAVARYNAALPAIRRAFQTYFKRRLGGFINVDRKTGERVPE